MENFEQYDAPESRPTLVEVAEPEPKGLSFQMEIEDFYAMEEARTAIRTKTRTAFITDAINHYVGMIQATGAKPGTPESKSPGGRLMELFGVLGIKGSNFVELRGYLIEQGVLMADSYWNIVLDRMASILDRCQ